MIAAALPLFISWHNTLGKSKAILQTHIYLFIYLFYIFLRLIWINAKIEDVIILTVVLLYPLLSNYLIVLPVSASIIQVQWRLLSYGAGYPGDRIRPDTAPVMWPPHSATRTWDKRWSSLTRKEITYFSPCLGSSYIQILLYISVKLFLELVSITLHLFTGLLYSTAKPCQSIELDAAASVGVS